MSLSLKRSLIHQSSDKIFNWMKFLLSNAVIEQTTDYASLYAVGLAVVILRSSARLT